MEIPRYTFPVTLIPGGCPQFLDFSLDSELFEQRSLRFVRSFREERRPGARGDGRENFLLHCIAENDKGGWTDLITGEPSPPSSYEVESRKCLDAYLDQWVPLPMPRVRDMKRPDGDPLFEAGPSNWARCRLTPPKNGGRDYRLVLAFDTTVEAPPLAEPGDERYFALSPGDVAANAVFRLAWHVRDNTWFLNAPWVDRWLFALHRDRPGMRRGQAESGFVMEYLAAYLTFLDVLNRLVPDTRVRVINPERDTPVDVDLILDIGNSRTTGILVETPPQRGTNLNNSYLLQIRDLSEPENVYAEPFATRIEFSEAFFGDDAYSRLSGRRTPAFPWASAVRMGPEAARLATRARCAEGATGMSSPKRYLWDERMWKPTWRFNTGGEYEPMVTRGSFAKQVNNMGTPLGCFDDPLIARNPLYRDQDREIAFESQFTRSSIMMFLMGEIIMQALVTINSPAQRERRELSDLPRRLRRIVFTVPSGMPIAEQRIYRRWVRFAVRTVWQAMGWQAWYAERRGQGGRGEDGADYRRSPETRCSWDEASCTQVVYLYNEIIHKFHGDAHQLFRLRGRARAAYGPYPSLRVASIDVGGGTTDLSIITYCLENDEGSTARVRPHMELRDGFALAGDDILRGVIGETLLPAIARAAAEQGVDNPRRILGECFGRDVIDNSQENRNLRAQFTRQIAAPVGLALLAAYEKSDPLRSPPMTFALRDFFDLAPAPGAEDGPPERDVPFAKAPPPSPAVIEYVEKTVRRAAPGSAFSLLDIALTMTPERMESTVVTVMQRILADLCEVIGLSGCDAVLLTGRPSKLHGVIASVLAALPVPADRIIPMCEYRVGRWYPFVDHLGMITDPKTTVSMGAILCALAEGHLEGFSFDTGALFLGSTARYIGEMDTNGQLAAPRVWFEADVESGKEQDLEKEILFTGPLSVGFRQFPVERWPTTRFYLVDFASEEDRRLAGGRLPYTVTLRFLQRGLEGATVQGEADEGELSVVSVLDSNGDAPRGGRKVVDVRLQTLPLDEGYWLDTGVLVTA